MNQNWWKLAVVVVLVVAVGGIFTARNRDSAVEPVTLTGQQKETPENLPRMIELGADKCVPCKMMKPIIAELQRDYKGKLGIVFVDVWKDTATAKKYKIRSIPTQIFMDKNGKEFFRHSGFFSKEDILKKFREHGIKL